MANNTCDQCPSIKALRMPGIPASRRERWETRKGERTESTNEKWHKIQLFRQSMPLWRKVLCFTMIFIDPWLINVNMQPESAQSWRREKKRETICLLSGLLNYTSHLRPANTVLTAATTFPKYNYTLVAMWTDRIFKYLNLNSKNKTKKNPKPCNWI